MIQLLPAHTKPLYGTNSPKQASSQYQVSLTQPDDKLQLRFGSQTKSPLKAVADLYLAGQELDIDSIRDKEGNNVLMSLIKAGDLETTEQLINDPRTILTDSPNHEGASLGHVLAQYGTPELIRKLADKEPALLEQVQKSATYSGAQSKLPGTYSKITPAVVSVLCGKEENALAFLEKGAPSDLILTKIKYADAYDNSHPNNKNVPFWTDPDAELTSLDTLAVRTDSQKVLEKLLQNPDLNPNPAYLVSAITGNSEALKKILKHPKTKIDTKDGQNKTAFCHAASDKSDEPTRLLLESDKFRSLSEKDQKATLSIKGQGIGMNTFTALDLAGFMTEAHPNIKVLLQAALDRLSNIE